MPGNKDKQQEVGDVGDDLTRDASCFDLFQAFLTTGSQDHGVRSRCCQMRSKCWKTKITSRISDWHYVRTHILC